MKEYIVKIFIVGSLFLSCSLFASDTRQGIMSSIGIGFGNVKTTLDGSSNNDISSGLLTIKFGYGFTDNFVGFIEGSNSDHTIVVDGKNVNISQESVGIGATYYLWANSFSPYVSAYAGSLDHSIETAIISNSSSHSLGDLWKLGAGCEYKQWFFQVDYIKAKSEIIDSNGVFGSIGYNFHNYWLPFIVR